MLPTIAHRRAAIVPPSVAADPDGLVYLMRHRAAKTSRRCLSMERSTLEAF
jgi:hypothetical protein